MKKMITSVGLAAFAAAALAPVAAYAEDPASSLAYNVGVVSDYRYRGISQTRLKPALQGGVDYSYGGFYVGAWASTIKWISDNVDANGEAIKGSLELDLYAGYKGAIVDKLGYDVGVLRYQYVGNKLKNTGAGNVYKNANTTEVYGALTYDVATLKVSYSISDLFGNYNFTTDEKSRGSYYADFSYNFDLGAGFTLTPHAGYQKVNNIPNASYADYSLTVTKEVVPGLTASLALVATSANDTFYYSPLDPDKKLGRNGVVAGVKYTF